MSMRAMRRWPHFLCRRWISTLLAKKWTQTKEKRREIEEKWLIHANAIILSDIEQKMYWERKELFRRRLEIATDKIESKLTEFISQKSKKSILLHRSDRCAVNKTADAQWKLNFITSKNKSSNAKEKVSAETLQKGITGRFDPTQCDSIETWKPNGIFQHEIASIQWPIWLEYYSFIA